MPRAFRWLTSGWMAFSPAACGVIRGADDPTSWVANTGRGVHVDDISGQIPRL